MSARPGSLLAARRGKLLLLLLCAVQFATARTSTLLGARAPRGTALTAGFHRALLACAVFLLAAADIALRAANTRGEPAQPSGTRAVPGQVPTPELAN